mmetsp:Transcript_46058/g.147104  ORF Transcript_46058/g.147104 Transcript_46058/m.147104 type:complete len:93 (+) Transcript_46058:203-481(+)
MNLATLRTISPSMSLPIAVIFTTTMVVGGPPGFLSALDQARLGHAIQHFMAQLLMGAVAAQYSDPEHWDLLLSHYKVFLAFYMVSLGRSWRR